MQIQGNGSVTQREHRPIVSPRIDRHSLFWIVLPASLCFILGYGSQFLCVDHGLNCEYVSYHGLSRTVEYSTTHALQAVRPFGHHESNPFDFYCEAPMPYQDNYTLETNGQTSNLRLTVPRYMNRWPILFATAPWIATLCTCLPVWLTLRRSPENQVPNGRVSKDKVPKEKVPVARHKEGACRRGRTHTQVIRVFGRALWLWSLVIVLELVRTFVWPATWILYVAMPLAVFACAAWTYAALIAVPQTLAAMNHGKTAAANRSHRLAACASRMGVAATVVVVLWLLCRPPPPIVTSRATRRGEIATPPLRRV